jgi:tRNA A-37 threonylcarbamoyl transferase component Bud32/Tol biopolymer transport system component
VVRFIARGGMGEVYEAEDLILNTRIALKTLAATLSDDPQAIRRLKLEVNLARRITHPNVCRIFDIGDADGYRFLTMEFATGGTLRDLIKKNQALRPLAERLADAAGAIAGLAAIHDAGIVHRDVKPDNMLRMADGRLVLSDFGLATDLPDSTMVSVFVGTPHYMAPEVREGDPATTRSDVWSLGVVLHEIFTGRRPERRNSRSGASGSRSPMNKTLSTIERAMLALCERCLADDPAERPADATAVQRLFNGAHRSPKAILRSPRRRLALATVVAVVVALSVGFGTRLYRRPPVRESAAQVGIPHVVPTGLPSDWSRVAKAVATVPGHVHCFSVVDGKTARVIWGTPRRAEDVALATGIRRPAPLASNTFATKCPQLSPSGRDLLYTTQNDAGANEIRLTDAEGRQSGRTITPGFDPIWLPNGEEFLYNVDSTHAAVFSLPTMHFALLPDPGAGGHEMILEKAVSEETDTLALLLGTSRGEWAVAVFAGRSLERSRTFTIPAANMIQFDRHSDNLLVSYQLSATVSTLMSLDWKNGVGRNLGRYPGLDLVSVRSADAGSILLGRHRTKDVWLYDRTGRHRLTMDGENYSAAISKAGDLLLSKRTADGGVSIWWQAPGGSSKQMTSGPADVQPEFSSDGRSWIYADYAKKSLMTCSSSDGTCRVLHRDEMLPSWPRYSPDGARIAYLSQVYPSRLVAIALRDSAVTQLGAAYPQCPPIWSSSQNLWGFEGTPGHYFWSERNVITGAKTGRTRDIEKTFAAADEVECWPKDEHQGSQFFQALRVETEERSDFLRLPYPSQ